MTTINSILNQPRDVLSGSTKTIPFEVERNHEGKGFSSSGRFTGINNGAQKIVQLKTGSNTCILSTLSVGVDVVPVDIEIFEDADLSSDGTSNTVTNQNRQSTTSADATVFTEPTVNSNGTEIFHYEMEGEKQLNLNQDSFIGPYVLKPNTEYLIRFSNDSGGSINLSWAIRFQEL